MKQTERWQVTSLEGLNTSAWTKRNCLGFLNRMENKERCLPHTDYQNQGLPPQLGYMDPKENCSDCCDDSWAGWVASQSHNSHGRYWWVLDIRQECTMQFSVLMAMNITSCHLFGWLNVGKIPWCYWVGDNCEKTTCGTCAVRVDVDGPIVHLSHCLNFQVVSINLHRQECQ